MDKLFKLIHYYTIMSKTRFPDEIMSIIIQYISSKTYAIQSLPCIFDFNLENSFKYLSTVLKKNILHNYLQTHHDDNKCNLAIPILSDYKIDPSINSNKFIRISSTFGHTEVVELLLKDIRVNPFVLNNKPIVLATENGHTEIFKLLFNNTKQKYDPVRITSLISFLLSKSVSKGHIDIVKILISDPLCTSKDKSHAVTIGLEHGHKNIVNLLLECKDVDPSYDYNRPIRLASAKGYIDIVRILLKDDRVYVSVCMNEAIRKANKAGYRCIVDLLKGHPSYRI